jgi:ABC-type uncharacterized transport system permease subunit
VVPGSRVGKLLRRALVPTLALITAFALGAVVIVLTDFEHLRTLGTDPAGALGGALGQVVAAYRALLAGAIGDPGRIVHALQSGQSTDIAKAIRPLTEALLGSTPYILVGLGLIVTFRAGLLNLGADGQWAIGGLGATVVTLTLAGHMPPAVILVLGMAGGTLAGAAYGFIPGLLKARTGAHEVITTLMLNAIAPAIVLTAMRSVNLSGNLRTIASTPQIFNLPTVRLDWSFVVGLLMAPVISFLLFRTTLGFELRASGFSRSVARSVGMRPGRSTMLAMSVSGGLAGMASSFIALGPVGHPSGPGDTGFVALALALIGGLRPSGVVLAGLLYGALNNGATTMVIDTGIPLALLMFIVAMAMLFVAAPGLVRSTWRVRLPRDPDAPSVYVDPQASQL